MRRERGITLIALVITIIVLIILAGVSIQLLLGENGIITKAKKGKGDYQEASIREKVEIALADYNSDKIVDGEEGEIEEALNKLYDNNTFDDIEIEENIGIIDDYEITLGKEKGEVIIDSIDKATGSIRLRCKLSTKEYTKESITIHVKASGNIAKLIKPDEKEVTPVNGRIEVDYPVNENGTYIFKVEDTEGAPLEKTVTVDNIDTLPPQDFDITAQQVDKKIVITANTEDTTDETGKSACSGIDRYEYFVKKSTDENYSEKPYTTNEIEITEYGTYNVFVKAYDKAGNSKDCKEEITIEIINQNPLKYGQKVNYSANGVNDWKIFYINDERNETFIITSYYILSSQVPKNETGLQKVGTWQVGWSNQSLLDFVEITEDVKTRFMVKWDTSNVTIASKMASKLLDINAWSIFVTDDLKREGSTAIGSPTLEMLTASWNEVYPNELIYPHVLIKDGYRYYQNKDKFVLSSYKGRLNTLYFPGYREDRYSGHRLLLASPLVRGGNETNFIACLDDFGRYWLSTTGGGMVGNVLRPVVCIPSNYLEYNTTTLSWDICIEP